MAVKSNKTTKKRKNTKKELSELKSEIESLQNKNVRLLAEFDNYKRRSLMEKENLIKYSGEGLVKNILSVIDDFDRVLINKNKENSNNPMFKGIELIYNKLIKNLNDFGIKSFKSIGENFDANFHEAIMLEKSKKKEGIVLKEFEKGYKFHDKILRHSKVIISKK